MKALKPPGQFSSYEILAIGKEKIVCHDKYDGKRVICFFRPEYRYYRKESTSFVKARFYLTKILHLLYPNNFPDMHWTGYEPLAYALEKVKTDPEHQRFNRMATLLNQGIGSYDGIESLQDKEEERLGSLRDKLFHQYKCLGIEIDEGIINFSINPESGVLMYLDHFNPWAFHRGRCGNEMKETFNLSSVQDAISKIENAQDKIRAERFLSRLIALFEEEKKNM